ncbi:prepilin peptidase [Micromonospora sp. WMMA1363]|uniref:prepilin peptidase n=1 Tax=Micromonospora sp. WMMA1363 TaxID=3053985 RepID=UPI00259CB6D6|nr:prepilin peptidase [Micromonospora sp. WMMA1363]MDM4721369.1 prepilin peptidase [Micromonospora sp. WMMA1363]
MDVLAASGLAVAGALAGIPIAAISYAAPAHGRLQVPAGWWRGAPARPAAVLAVSLMAGAAAWLVVWRLPTTIMPAFWAFAVVGVGLAVIDVRRRRLPYALTGTLATVCVICFLVAAAINGNYAALLRAVVAGSATTAALLLIALALPGQLGLGDVALAGAITLSLGWLSWQAAAVGILCGLMIQGFLGVVAKARTRIDSALPMGPALLAGWLSGALLAPIH